ncbi:MAG: PIN domain-containing protein [Candidatus Thorarchaeota archaeon]
MPLQVILDTNFLTVPVQFGVDVFDEAERVLERSVEFVLLQSVIDEIKSKIERARKTESRMFNVALDLSKRCRVVTVDQPLRDLKVDDQLLEHATSVGGVLATNDRELRDKALERGIPVLMLRGKKHLELQGTIF